MALARLRAVTVGRAPHQAGGVRVILVHGEALADLHGRAEARAVGFLESYQDAEEGVGEGRGLFEGCEVAGVGEHDQVRACYVGTS